MRILKHLLLPLLLILSLLGFDRVSPSGIHPQGSTSVLPVIWLKD
ncbi:hypothetical protein NNO07_21535 [Pseudomonas resinovorans]|uniref:Uncharacterized protein n=1 Tax=Metapseudomonas resinovorans TaxID=53412 RepID=A0ABT4Y9V3_METRE|nr:MULTISPECIES: hypothetical protein [Pseudomonas]MDA8485659.1 hypothetical protein [Pseudomonas resinovorans]